MDTTIRCHMCGAVDLARATACKRCGARFTSEENAQGAGGAYGPAGGAYGAGANSYGARPYPPPRTAAASSSRKKSCPVCSYACAPSAGSCPACGHRFPGLRARYIVVPLSFLVVLLLFAAMKYFDEKAKETHIRNLESGIARQYGIVDTTVHPKPQKPWFWSFFRSKPTASEVFAHNLEVSGGADALANIKSMRATAMLSVNPVKAAVYPAYDTVTAAPPAKMVMRAKAPDKILAEVEMKLSSRETGYGRRTLRRGFDGARGWEQVESEVRPRWDSAPVRQSEVREFAGAELEEVKHYASATGLVRLADAYGSLVMLPNRKVTTREFYGLKEFDRECYVVRGLNAEKKFETFYFDIDTGLVVRFDFDAQGPDGPTTVECYPDNYREVDKLNVPFRLSFKVNDLWMTVFFEEYELDEPIDDSTFAPPPS